MGIEENLNVEYFLGKHYLCNISVNAQQKITHAINQAIQHALWAALKHFM